ncbi:hypothetical protein [Rasiella sp. SM2506]|uniref:hypothetical protein n=1 Tax=Rasiella sp. SM2506 TaxID=3423914 RepID=UPI003D7B8F82
MSTHMKPPTSFWVITILALLWNLIGIFQFFSATILLEAVVAALPQEQADLYTGMPTWYLVIFGIAVFSGVLACITMLLRKKVTVGLFGISLLTVLVSQGYWLFGTEVMTVLGMTAAIMPLVVITISIFLYFYSKGASRNGWLS